MDKLKLPQIGFGTWQLKGNTATEAVKHAIDIGYRHIDTAQIYKNEAEVGKGIAESGIPRKDLIIATKIWITEMSRKKIHKSMKKSLKKLQLDYVDIIYLHWPSGDYDPKSTLLEASKIIDKGQAKYLGISNFTPKLIKEAIKIYDKPIIANQIEAHPLLQQRRQLELLTENNMYLVAYSPLARGEIMNNETIIGIAKKHKVTSTQIILAWEMKKGWIPIPKSRSKDHIKENYDAINIILDAEDIAKIDNLDCNGRVVSPEALKPNWGEE